ncbi:hypothetical protein EDF50_0333 [Frigoribacterium sp. PhB24]|nr:hypothetical protein EDF50_0333 [Frigoribacterium sp. PhB24]
MTPDPGHHRVSCDAVALSLVRARHRNQAPSRVSEWAPRGQGLVARGVTACFAESEPCSRGSTPSGRVDRARTDRSRDDRRAVREGCEESGRRGCTDGMSLQGRGEGQAPAACLGAGVVPRRRRRAEAQSNRVRRTGRRAGAVVWASVEAGHDGVSRRQANTAWLSRGTLSALDLTKTAGNPQKSAAHAEGPAARHVRPGLRDVVFSDLRRDAMTRSRNASRGRCGLRRRTTTRMRERAAEP